MRAHTPSLVRSAAIAASLAAALLASASCEGPGLRKIGDATLAVLADGTMPVPPEAQAAPTVEVLPDTPATIPDAPMVKLAIDRRAPWGQVKAILNKMNERGQQPIILVALRRNVESLYINDELDGPYTNAYATNDGKICVHHPDINEAKCVQTRDKNYIDASFVRELVREAVKGYRRTNILVSVPDELPWIDVVAAVGGARSCCDQPVRVKVKNFPHVDMAEGAQPAKGLPAEAANP